MSDNRFDDEVQFHLEQQIAKHIRAGMAPDEARRQALLKFGGVEPVREAARDERRGAWVFDLLRDMKVGLRTLRRVPSFAVTVVLTFALGIGAAAAMFSVFEAVLLRPLPYPGSDRIASLYQLGESGARNRVSDPNYADWREGTSSFAAMAEVSPWGPQPIAGAGDAQLARVTFVTQEFFDVMGVRPMLGRTFRPEEQQPGGPPAVVVSASFWRRWKGDAQPQGEVIRSGPSTFTVIGVMPDGFDFPGATAIWGARGLTAPNPSRTSHNASVVARLADGVSMDQARSELSALSRRLKEQWGTDTWMFDADVVPLLEVVTSASRSTLRLLFVASVLLLVVACTNVSNLLLARAASRRSEFALQLAIGATSGRLARQLLAETLVVCLSGALLGVALAVAAIRLFVAMGPVGVSRLDSVSVSWPAVAFALTVSTLAAVALSVVTALGTRGTRISDALTDSTRSGTGGRRQLRVREGLIVTQVALTLVLLAGAALLGRSLNRVMAVDPGYSLDEALIVGLTIPGDGSPESLSRQVAFQDTVISRLRQQPGVTNVGLVSSFPLGSSTGPNGTFIEMTRPDEITSFDQFDPESPVFKARSGYAEFRHVSDGYFTAMQIPLLDGRLIDDRDTPDSPHVAVVSRSMAEQQWPDRSALGRWIQFGNMDGDLRPIQIVGVVDDVKEISPEGRSRPTLYVSARQRPRQAGRASIVVRGPAAVSLVETARRIVRDVDPDVPATFTSVSAALDTALGNRRFTLWLVGAFGVAALTLAMLGVYGLFAYIVSQRTREMGIRMALGAEPGSLVWLIVKRGAVLAGIGAVLGVLTSQLAAGLLTGLLFEVSPTDPLTIGATVATLLFASVVASYAPARRILRQSPGTTLRDI